MNWTPIKDKPVPIGRRIAIRSKDDLYSFGEFVDFGTFASWHPDGVSGYEWECDFEVDNLTHWAEIEEPK